MTYGYLQMVELIRREQDILWWLLFTREKTKILIDIYYLFIT